MPNLSGRNADQSGRRAELGSSSSLNDTGNLSIPNSLSSPNNLTILGAKSKGKEQSNDDKLGGEFQKGKRLSNQLEKKNFSVGKGLQIFPRFRSNSSFNLVADYESGTDDQNGKQVGSERTEDAGKGVGEKRNEPNDRPETRPSSVPHLTERKPPIRHKFGIRKLFGSTCSSKKGDPEKKIKNAKNDKGQYGDALSEASDRLKPLPRKLPPVEVLSRKEKPKSQKCAKCKKKPCKYAIFFGVLILCIRMATI